MRGWLACAVVALAVPAGAEAQFRRQTATPEEIAAAEAAVDRFVSTTLRRFESEAELRAYAEAVERLESLRYRRWSGSATLQFAQAQQPGSATQTDAAEPPCDPQEDENCGEVPVAGQEGSVSVVITGSRIQPRNASITNNQMSNVEEGDIVKQIDDYLLVLQDGRIFVVHIRAGGGRGLALVDRMNVYREVGAEGRWETWYDEMLVFGDRILVTGYSYPEDATELSVFRLSPEGRLTREGVFFMSSNDYYSTSNYATRLIGDDLVIYTPYDLSEITGGEWPVVRRWRSEAERAADEREGRRLLDARNIYRPVRATEDPYVHTVSVCPLGEARSGSDLECRTTAFVGPDTTTWYVTDSDVFIWLSAHLYGLRPDAECETGRPFTPGEIAPALLYRIPVSGAAAAVGGVRGVPFDQFSMQANDGRLRALVEQESVECRDPYDAEARLALIDLPLNSLGGTLAEVPPDRYARLPGVGTRWVANRFTQTHLVYGGLSQYRRGLPDVDWERYADIPDALRHYRRELNPGPAYVVPLDQPKALRRLDVGHTVVRAERVGNDFVLTGYRDRGGLHLTMIDADGPPRIASTIRLNGRYESEGRSHAFNSLIEPDGGGIMALPTSPRREDSARWWWRSRASDMSFIAFDPDGSLGRLGELQSSVVYDRRDEEDEDGIAGYECEVSCVDWYGNSRPIFTDGRIFALSGVELIEGRIEQGRIREVQRLNIAVPGARR